MRVTLHFSIVLESFNKIDPLYITTIFQAYHARPRKSLTSGDIPNSYDPDRIVFQYLVVRIEIDMVLMAGADKTAEDLVNISLTTDET